MEEMSSTFSTGSLNEIQAVCKAISTTPSEPLPKSSFRESMVRLLRRKSAKCSGGTLEIGNL